MTRVPPVRKQITVDAPAARCWRMFTDGIDRWWPRAHHIGASPMKRAVIEPREGGRWYAECEDGSECDTGRVLVWQPPERLVLSWQITADWKYDPDFTTEVEIRFVADGSARTRVELEHRNLDRHGEGWQQMRDAVGSPDGWEVGMRRFAERVKH